MVPGTLGAAGAAVGIAAVGTGQAEEPGTEAGLEAGPSEGVRESHAEDV